MRLITRLASLLVTALLITSGMAQADTSPRYGGTLIVGMQDEPPILDPHLANSNAARNILHNIFATLVDTNEQLVVVPELAQSWDVSSNGLEYVFHLRTDVVFHDGTPFDAEAVKYNFARMMDPDFGSARGAEVAVVDVVTVLDPYTVQVTLTEPFAAFLPAMASWAGMMVSPSAAEAAGADFSTTLVGAGPFRFVDFVRDDRVVLERFDEYFKDGLPYLDGVTYRFFPDAEARMLNLESGAVHMIDIVPGRAVDRFADNKNIVLSLVGGLGFNGFWMNTQSSALGNVDRRAAVSACIDRQVLVDTIMGTAAVPGFSPYSPATWVWDGDMPEAPARDLELAKAHLAAAGVPDGFTFTLLITPDEQAIRTGSMISAMCAEVGIKIELQQVQVGEILARMPQGNHEASLINLSPRTDPDLSAYVWFHSDAPINFALYGNPDMDRLLEAARKAVDINERRGYYQQSVEIFNRDFPYIFTHHPAEMKAFRATVHGYRHNPDGMMRFEDVWLDGSL